MSFYDKKENCVKKLFTTNSAETNQHDQKTSDDLKKHFAGHVEEGGILFNIYIFTS